MHRARIRSSNPDRSSHFWCNPVVKAKAAFRKRLPFPALAYRDAALLPDGRPILLETVLPGSLLALPPSSSGGSPLKTTAGTSAIISAKVGHHVLHALGSRHRGNLPRTPMAPYVLNLHAVAPMWLNACGASPCMRLAYILAYHAVGY